jgi:sugar transferase EpsL
MRTGSIGAVCKRGLDIVGALSGLLILSPVLLAVAIVLRFSMGRPILFSQQRAGLDGRPFTLFKFRTMLVSQSAEIDPATDAARLTRLGSILRNASLDELPQLWNVLKGEMSLVGPRPLLLEYLPYYTARQSRRHWMKPGITGLAQIKGRNAVTWEQKFLWDVWYVEHWSISLDLRILLATIAKVIKREDISRQGHVTTGKFGAEGR